VNIANLIKDAEELREIYLNAIVQCLLPVLKPVASSNFIGNNQSIPDGSNACLRSKENVEKDTNRQIFETPKKIQCPLICLFKKNLMNYYYSYFTDFLMTCVLEAEITRFVYP